METTFNTSPNLNNSYVIVYQDEPWCVFDSRLFSTKQMADNAITAWQDDWKSHSVPAFFTTLPNLMPITISELIDHKLREPLQEI